MLWRICEVRIYWNNLFINKQAGINWVFYYTLQYTILFIRPQTQNNFIRSGCSSQLINLFFWHETNCKRYYISKMPRSNTKAHFHSRYRQKTLQKYKLRFYKIFALFCALLIDNNLVFKNIVRITSILLNDRVYEYGTD